MKIEKLILLLLLTLSLAANAQTNSEQLEKASKLAAKNKDQAIEMLQAILKSEPDTSLVYARAFFNIAVIYSMKKDVENTKLWYHKIMNSNLDSKQPGESFMESYACYQHNAAMQLGVFLFHHKLAQEALETFELAKIKYPYLSTSGTSLGNRANTIEIWRARCYAELGEHDETIATLISCYFDCYVPMKDKLDDIIGSFISQIYGEEALKKALETGLKGIKRGSVKNNMIVGERIIWTIPFNNTTITVCVDEKNDSAKSIKELILSANWYK